MFRAGGEREGLKSLGDEEKNQMENNWQEVR